MYIESWKRAKFSLFIVQFFLMICVINVWQIFVFVFANTSPNICIPICIYPFFVNPNIFILVFKNNVKSNHKMLYFLLLQIKYHKMYLWYHRGNLGTALLQQTIFWRFHLKPTKIIIQLAFTRILLFSWHFIFHPYFVAFRKQAKFQYESISPLSEGAIKKNITNG